MLVWDWFDKFMTQVSRNQVIKISSNNDQVPKVKMF